MRLSATEIGLASTTGTTTTSRGVTAVLRRAVHLGNTAATCNTGPNHAMGNATGTTTTGTAVTAADKTDAPTAATIARTTTGTTAPSVRTAVVVATAVTEAGTERRAGDAPTHRTRAAGATEGGRPRRPGTNAVSRKHLHHPHERSKSDCMMSVGRAPRPTVVPPQPPCTVEESAISDYSDRNGKRADTPPSTVDPFTSPPFPLGRLHSSIEEFDAQPARRTPPRNFGPR